MASRPMPSKMNTITLPPWTIAHPEDNAGAGHLGTVEYNSATLYRYATVNALELAGVSAGKRRPGVVRAFAEAFHPLNATGKQNTFANRTLPDAVYIAVRCDQPVNLCGAFEKAVPASAEGFVEPSKKRLADYAQELYRTYAGAPGGRLYRRRRPGIAGGGDAAQGHAGIAGNVCPAVH